MNCWSHGYQSTGRGHLQCIGTLLDSQPISKTPDTILDDAEAMTDSQPDIGHEIGEHNIQLLGLDIHNPVFVVSALLTVAIVIGTLLFQEASTVIFGEMRVWITSKFDWFFVISTNIFVIICFAVASSRLGSVRLGGPSARPHYNYAAWLALECLRIRPLRPSDPVGLVS